jgi:hypothetical protein
MPDMTTTTRQVRADTADDDALTKAHAAAGDDDGTDDDGTSGDDLPEHVRAAIRRANRQAAKARPELQAMKAQQEAEAEERRKAALTAEERAKEAERKAAQVQADAEARVQRAERLVALAGKVNHPDRVLRLMDDPTAYFDGNTPDLERIRADFPEYAPQAAAPAAPPPARVSGAAGIPARRPNPQDKAAQALASGDVGAYAAAEAARMAARRAKP